MTYVYAACTVHWVSVELSICMIIIWFIACGTFTLSMQARVVVVSLLSVFIKLVSNAICNLQVHC